MRIARDSINELRVKRIATKYLDNQTVMQPWKFFENYSEWRQHLKITNSKESSDSTEVTFKMNLTIKLLNMRVWSWLRMNAGGVLNTCKSNGVLMNERFSLLLIDFIKT